MKVVYTSVLAVISVVPHRACAQKIAENPPEPTETDICQILSKPYAYNNKIVKVRGYLILGPETSALADGRCDLWLAFADGAAPPQLVAIVNGNGTVGGKGAGGRRTSPTPIRLVRDANWEQLEHYMNHNAKVEDCLKGPGPDLDRVGDCTPYRITATFSGRIDGVSKPVFESRLKRKSEGRTDSRGFGHMGMCDAQIVVKSVEEVVAVPQ